MEIRQKSSNRIYSKSDHLKKQSKFKKNLGFHYQNEIGSLLLSDTQNTEFRPLRIKISQMY